MRIPIRAVYARGTKPGEMPRLIDATYAEVPDTLVMGTMAQAGVELASVRGDNEGAHRLSDAIAAVCRDGKIQTL